MEEKRKKLVAKKNELQMLAKRLSSMRKRCDHLEFVSFSNSKGYNWYRKKTRRFRKGHKDTKRVYQKIKLMGIQISGYNVITAKKGGSYTRLPIFLPFRKNGIVVSILIQTIIFVVILKKKNISKIIIAMMIIMMTIKRRSLVMTMAMTVMMTTILTMMMMMMTIMMTMRRRRRRIRGRGR